uniref:Inter-alpha-trypsin inhibitor heavy chain H4-like n=2 Tax=Photinus pyralis TaxID=7054 RepID=A0A1Y1M955_PHOPY
MILKFQLLVFGVTIVPILSIASDHDSAMVISTTTSQPRQDGKESEDVYPLPTVPQIYEVRIRSNISNRFAHTVVVSKMKNYARTAKEVRFSMLLPESAFISGFIMEVGGVNYTATVKEKKEAQSIYNKAVASGDAAAHVAVSARDSSRFTVSANVKPEEKAAFYLTYEEFLVRRNDHYEQIINIHPGQPVKNLLVEVVISESRKITHLKAPPLRSGNEIGSDKLELDPRADISIVNDTAATVTFNPNVERQKALAHIFGTKVENGLVGQFVVQYDVERDPQGGEVLVQDGYFVHYFAPTDLQPLPKQVIFILDTSGSMRGQKIQQLKEAMYKILDQLHERDLFNLVEFNSNARVVDLDNEANSVWYPRREVHSTETHPAQNAPDLQNVAFPRAYFVNDSNIEAAKKAVSKLLIDGSTVTCSAIKVGLRLAEVERTNPQDSVERQPIIIFLTDGRPTDPASTNVITQVTEYNSDLKHSVIFALGFGGDVDMEFLQKLAQKNSGYAKPIYVAADTSLQLQDFYRQISSPLLANVSFRYEPSVTSLTRTEFPIHFGGSELVVAGFCGDALPSVTIDGIGVRGRTTLKPTVTRTISNMERLWAYLNIKQLLENKDVSENETSVLKEKALDLALKYSFVTPVSSLVVVKPNDTSAVDMEQVKQKEYGTRPLYSPMRGRARSKARTHSVLTQQSELNRLLSILPWLRGLLSGESVKLPQGTYKLGINETITDIITCPKTPLNEEGYCRLLKSCPGVDVLLKSSSDFYDHFCVLKNEFAGVCCPRN